MLSLLLDENISHEIARQVTLKRPEIRIQSLHYWEDGRFLKSGDRAILLAATIKQRTLVTYDIQTIPALLIQLHNEGFDHGGVVFVSQHAIPSHDFGGLIRAIIQLWDAHQEDDWTNKIRYLKPAS